MPVTDLKWDAELDGCQVGGGEITEVGGHHTHNAEAHKKAPGLGKLKSRER